MLDTGRSRAGSYQVCSKTVMDTSDPEITFDENGISSHYWDFQKNVLPNWHPDSNSPKLEKTLEQIRKDGSSRDFDCIIGLSGGLDSSYMLHKVVTEYGLRPLVFHVDGGWNSQKAVHNINALVDTLKLDLFTEVIDWREMREFQLALFKAGIPHLDTPQDLAFISVLYKFAEKYRIKYILNGGNVATESVKRPLSLIYWGTDMRHNKFLLKEFSGEKFSSYPFISVFYHKLYLRYIKRIKVFKPLNYVNYVKKDAEQELRGKYNWQSFPQKHYESRFTRFFEGYWLLNRFGYDMRRNEFSSLILSGQMSREEAIERLSTQPLSESEIKEEFRYIATKLEISEEQLGDYFRLPLRFFSDYPNNNRVFELGEKVLMKLQGTRRGGAF